MNSIQLSQRYNRYLLSICVAALALLCVTSNLRANILDDLFSWAVQQPPSNSKTIKYVMTSSELTRNNLVSYSEGTLYYNPASSSGGIFHPASFASSKNGITQYFSDRRFNFPVGSLNSAPFDPANTDPLTITISKGVNAVNYSIDLISSKWGFTLSFVPSFNVNTNILYGVIGNGFFTVSLGDKLSEPPLIIK
jgi:hypothetical protein